MSESHDTDLETALLHGGELLLNGWGYNWYRTENRMRADDVLLRNQADALLGDAMAAFRRAEAVFRHKHAGAPSRAHPLPDPDRLEELHILQAALADLEEVRTRLRGAAMPPADKIWARHRDETDLLSRLGQCDAKIAGSVQALRQEALAITPAGLAGMPALIAPRVRQLLDLLDQRAAMLNVV